MTWKTKIAGLSSHFKVITLPTHILFFISLYLIFKSPQNSHFLVYIPILWFCFSCLGIAIGYHRLFSHKSFQTNSFVRRLLSFFGMFACQGSPIFWTAVHRSLHHRYSDTAKDPHTPVKGFWFSYFGWQMYFSAKDFDPRHAIDLVRDPFLRFTSTYYYQMFWLTLVAVASINWEFFIFAVIPAMIISTHQENVVNSFCHTPALGYTNFQTKDQSRNIWILGFLLFGQGYHNNHHAFPNKSSFGHFWWEFDICPYIIIFLKSSESEDVYEKNKNIEV